MLHIITLTWQGKEKLKKLYPSLMEALNGIEYQFHIKENGSTDGSVEEIESWNNPNINLIKYKHNKDSYSFGMNFLFKEANPKNDDIILTLNNDIVIKDPKSLKNMINILNNDKDVGIVGAKLNYMDTDKIQHCGVLFHKMNGLPYHYRAGVQEEERDKANRYYPAITGAVSILKADTFANCYTKNKSGQNGFCEGYFFAFEDIDMNLHIAHHLKKKIVYCGDTMIFHEESASLKKNPINKLFFNSNCNLFLQKWHSVIDKNLTDKYNNPKFNLYNGASQ